MPEVVHLPRVIHQEQAYTHLEHPLLSALRAYPDPEAVIRNGGYLPTGKTHDHLMERDTGKDPRNQLDLGLSCNTYDDTAIPNFGNQELEGAAAREDIVGYLIPTYEASENNPPVHENHVYNFTD